jgi:hypothetical protein
MQNKTQTGLVVMISLTPPGTTLFKMAPDNVEAIITTEQVSFAFSKNSNWLGCYEVFDAISGHQASFKVILNGIYFTSALNLHTAVSTL